MKGNFALVLAALFGLLPTLVGGVPGAAGPGPDQAAGTQFVNGNFDSGPGIGWADYSEQGFDVVVTEFGTGVSARSGRYAAWLGG